MERIAAAKRSNTERQRDVTVSSDNVGDVLGSCARTYRDRPRP